MSVAIEAAKLLSYAIVALLAVAAGWFLGGDAAALSVLAVLAVVAASLGWRRVMIHLASIEARMLSRTDFHNGAGAAAGAMSEEHGILDGHIRYVGRGVDRIEERQEAVSNQIDLGVQEVNGRLDDIVKRLETVEERGEDAYCRGYLDGVMARARSATAAMPRPRNLFAIRDPQTD